MSALAGLLHHDGRPEAAEAVERMLAAQSIYGPHHKAQWDGGSVALGRCLHRMLPEDIHDQAPQTGGAGRFVLVADARLDNRDELIAALAIEPEAARRLPEAALLLAAWERWGQDSVDHLVGDYAFALWDTSERKLFLARDPLGNRPLHYHAGSGFFAFASMPKGLHALEQIPRAPDEERAAEFLALLPEAGPRSFFEGVSRVEAGQILAVSPGGNLTTRRYWQPPESGSIGVRSDHAEGLRHHLDQAVAARLRGAGERVGTHLSAGRDSSSVTASAALAGAARGMKVTAFTSVPRPGFAGAVPAGQFGDEGVLAAQTAALYPDVEHVRVHTDYRTVSDNLDRDFYLFDRPLVNACNQRWVNAINAEAQRRGIKVLLPAIMGNFTISYTGTEHFAELAAKGQLLRLLRDGRSYVRNGGSTWRHLLAVTFAPWMSERLWLALRRRFRGEEYDLGEYSAVNPERRRALDLEGRAAALGYSTSVRPMASAGALRRLGLSRVDLGNMNKGALAGWGVDLRDPTSDRRLIEYCLSLPSGAFIAGGRPRALLRAAFGDRLPGAVLDEPRKGLQAADWYEGMTASRDEIRREIERLEQVPAAVAALDLARMKALVEDWPEGGWETLPVRMRYRLALLRGVVSGHFLRKASPTNS